MRRSRGKYKIIKGEQATKGCKEVRKREQEEGNHHIYPRQVVKGVRAVPLKTGAELNRRK